MERIGVRTRSSVPKEERENKRLAQITKKKQLEEEEANKPFIEYKGIIDYVKEFGDIAMKCDKLIDRAEASSDFLVLGFDLEWHFSFQTGPGKVAIMQISPDLETCYILEVSKLKSLPKAVSVLLAHPKIRITGVNIKNDIRKLARDFTVLDVEKAIENCIDSGVLANQILQLQQRWSMEKLVGYLLKMKMNKHKKVRMSKWHISPLSEVQLQYAATDGYASLLLYLELQKKTNN